MIKSNYANSTSQAILSSQNFNLGENFEYCKKWPKMLQNELISVSALNRNTILQYKNSNQLVTISILSI